MAFWAVGTLLLGTLVAAAERELSPEEQLQSVSAQLVNGNFDAAERLLQRWFGNWYPPTSGNLASLSPQNQQQVLLTTAEIAYSRCRFSREQGDLSAACRNCQRALALLPGEPRFATTQGEINQEFETQFLTAYLEEPFAPLVAAVTYQRLAEQLQGCGGVRGQPSHKDPQKNLRSLLERVNGRLQQLLPLAAPAK